MNQFEEHTINMPTALKLVQQFSGSIGDVLERSFKRSTNELKKVAAVCLSFGSHVKCIIGDIGKNELVESMKKVIAHCLAEDPTFRTRGIKVTSAKSIVDNIQKQLTSLFNSQLNSSSLIIKNGWFESFNISDDSFQCYEYQNLTMKRLSKIINIESISGYFYDWKHHFGLTIETSGQDGVKKVHVVINECNVLKTFFDHKVNVEIFGDNELSPMLRLCESLCQNNECPVESIISMFSAQAFRGQHEDTAENRAIIKINGDTIVGAEDFCSVLAEMSVKGVPEWGIDPLTLPIRYGRYVNSVAKGFQKIESQKAKKFDYMYKYKGENFALKMNQIASGFEEVEMNVAADEGE